MPPPNTKNITSRYKTTPHFPTVDYSFKNIASLDDPEQIFKMKPRSGKRAPLQSTRARKSRQNGTPLGNEEIDDALDGAHPSQHSRSTKSFIERLPRYASSQQQQQRAQVSTPDSTLSSSYDDPFKSHTQSFTSQNNNHNTNTQSSAQNGTTKRQRPKYLGTSLKLSENQIESLHGLKETIETIMRHPAQLAWLDLSFNMIQSLEELPLDYPLKSLYLHGNQIYDIQQLIVLRRFRELKSLTLHGCPVAETKNYRFQVLALLPQLRKLDFTGVTAKDRETAESFVKFFGNTFGR
mmetsp:Transcript_2064/g.7438  ORF Transcript_2064/g.7438 Transcript_2064/m.7438 type:complete len:294 (+) Transcript_2064:362-1243(+)